MYRKVLSSKRF